MSIAIIGAGIAGLTAAWTLRDEVVVFEKSRGLTGRAATRWYDRPAGRVYVDHGAQFIRTEATALHSLMLTDLPTEELTDISDPVWTFSAAGVISEGDSAQNRQPKWSYRRGLATLGRLIAERAALRIYTSTRIASVDIGARGRFTVIDSEGQAAGDFSQLIIAIPAGQATDLIAASRLPAAERATLVSGLRAAVYRRCLSVTLGFDRPLTARLYYALLNTDRAHAISWLGLEHAKPGHTPSGQAVLVVQMSGGYSLARWDTAAPELIQEVAALASALLGEDLTAPDWSDVQRWRYSQPDVLADPRSLNGVIDGLWFAGDYLRGGRLHLAAETGHDAAHSAIGHRSAR
jgi:predicted NAD/FAD-dependent oxidoreductase